MRKSLVSSIVLIVVVSVLIGVYQYLKIEELEKKIVEQDSMIIELNFAIDNYTELNEQLTSKLDKSKGERLKEVDKNKSLENTIAEKDKKITYLKDRSNTFESKANSKEKEIANLKKQVQDLKK